MLTMFFWVCAVAGGAVVLTQLLFSVVAFGAGHGAHFHHQHGGGTAAHGGGGGGGARAMHRGGTARGRWGHHGAQRGGGQRGGGRGGRGGQRAMRAAAKGGKAGAQKPQGSHVASASHWTLGWLQSMFNFQGIVSGATVLGLAGLAATAAKLPGVVAVVIGVAAALVMMALVEGIFGLMLSMDNDGTVNLESAVGQMGTVYLGIPAKNEGQGKVTVSVQQRLMEFPAVTQQEAALATGQKVIVVAVREAAVMEVVSAEKYLRDIQG